MYTPEVQNQINQWRAKANAGTLSLEEMKAAVLLMRGDRKSAHATSETARRSKAKKEVRSADDLLGELDKL